MSKQTPPIPTAVLRKASVNRDIDGFVLLTWFDSLCFTEVTAKTKRQFETYLAFWKKDTLPTLRKDTRYFVRLGPNADLIETTRNKL
jgi:hypothetical protein